MLGSLVAAADTVRKGRTGMRYATLQACLGIASRDGQGTRQG